MSETEVTSPQKGRLRRILTVFAAIACFIAPFFVVWVVSGIGSALLMYGACFVTMCVFGLIAHFVIPLGKE